MDISGPAVSLAFRIAVPGDVDDLVTLIESAYRGETSRQGWTTEADLLGGQRTDPRGVAEAMTRPGGRLIVVERGAALVACCQLEHREPHAYFGMFAVRPHLQGGGLGRAVLAEAERVAREELRAMQMRMSVISARTDLIAWYERRGYQRTGETSPFPYGNERFGLPKRPDLEFATLAKEL